MVLPKASIGNSASFQIAGTPYVLTTEADKTIDFKYVTRAITVQSSGSGTGNKISFDGGTNEISLVQNKVYRLDVKCKQLKITRETGTISVVAELTSVESWQAPTIIQSDYESSGSSGGSGGGEESGGGGGGGSSGLATVLFHLDDGTTLTNSCTPDPAPANPVILTLDHGGGGTNPPGTATGAGTYDESFTSTTPASGIAAFSTSMQFNLSNPDITGDDRGTTLNLELGGETVNSQSANGDVTVGATGDHFGHGDTVTLTNQNGVATIFEFTTANNTNDGSTIESNGGASGNTNINVGINENPSTNAPYVAFGNQMQFALSEAINANGSPSGFYSSNGNTWHSTMLKLQVTTAGEIGNYSSSTGYPFIEIDTTANNGYFATTPTITQPEGGVDGSPTCATSGLCMEDDFTFDFWFKFEGTLRDIGALGTNGVLSQCIFGSSNSSGITCIYAEGLTTPLGFMGVTLDYGFIYSHPATANQGWGIGIVLLPTTHQSSGLGTEWHHFGITRDGTAMKIYIDGELCDNYVVGPFAESAAVEFAGTQFADRGFVNTPFVGSIDEIRLIDGTAIDFDAEGIPDAPDTCS